MCEDNFSLWRELTRGQAAAGERRDLRDAAGMILGAGSPAAAAAFLLTYVAAHFKIPPWPLAKQSPSVGFPQPVCITPRSSSVISSPLLTGVSSCSALFKSPPSARRRSTGLRRSGVTGVKKSNVSSDVGLKPLRRRSETSKVTRVSERVRSLRADVAQGFCGELA